MLCLVDGVFIEWFNLPHQPSFKNHSNDENNKIKLN